MDENKVMALPSWTGQRYTFSFLSEEPLQSEMETALRLLASGRTWDEARQEILKENMFQLRRLNTVRTRLKLVRRRLAWFDDELRRLYLQGEAYDRPATLLYTFLASYRLPREFVFEELRYRWKMGQPMVTTSDVMSFLERKSEQCEEIYSKTPSVLNRARQVTIRLLTSYQLLERSGNRWYIHPVAVSYAWQKHIVKQVHGRDILKLLLLE